ncbi:MAG: hypothetical protein LBO20_04115 [Bifidobacteriaceae bacterium]|nr:hypothetical protein [Bifidobacteriaceae bacterium]
MRSTLKAWAAGLTAAVLLAGCAGNQDDGDEAPLTKGDVSVKPAELPTLAGAWGELPTIAFPLREGESSPSPAPSDDPAVEGEPADPAVEEPAGQDPAASPSPSASASEAPSPYIKPPSKLQVQVQPDMAGDGPEVKAENLVAVDYAVWEWGQTEASLYANSFTSGTPMVLPVRSDNPTLLGLSRVVVGQKVGSRVMGVIPPTVGTLSSAIGLDDGTTLVVVIDIKEQFDKGVQAQKDAQPTGAKTGPQVTGSLGGPAKVSVAGDLEPPEEVSLTVLATGTGPEVETGQQVLVHYSATDWGGKADGDTWAAGRGPEAVTVQSDPTGDGSQITAFGLLAGVPVGSRVLILTPGKEGSYLADAIVLDIVALVGADKDDKEDEAGDGSASSSPSPSGSTSPPTSPSADSAADSSAGG